MNFTTILLDGDIVLHRACSVASTKIQWDDEVSWSVDLRQAGGFIREELAKLRRKLGAKKVLIALGDRRANFRKELYAEYKAHRAAFPKPPGFLELEARLKAHAKTVSEPRLEGDDMLGLLATKEPLEGKVIVTIDKDLRQIPGWHYNPDSDTLFEVTPEEGERWHLHQTLTGDRTDNYPGCPGIGTVRALRLLGDKGATWEVVLEAFEKAGKTEEDALLQARLARILRQGDYDRKTKTVRMWTPAS